MYSFSYLYSFFSEISRTWNTTVGKSITGKHNLPLLLSQNHWKTELLQATKKLATAPSNLPFFTSLFLRQELVYGVGGYVALAHRFGILIRSASTVARRKTARKIGFEVTVYLYVSVLRCQPTD